MNSKNHTNWLVVLLTITAVTLGVTACGGNTNELIYRVTGTATEAKVNYTDIDGNAQEETVTLPWETKLEIRDDFEFHLSASNNHPSGEIMGEVWLNDRKLGDQDSPSYVDCLGSVFLENGNPSSFFSYSGESFLGDVKKLMGEGKLDQALSKAEELIELAPNYPSAYYFQGLVFTAMEKHDLALEAYSQAITLDPKFVDAYNKRGITYANLSEYEQSIADFSTTIELAPDFAVPYYGRGVVYSLVGERDLARADMLMVSEISDNPEIIAMAEKALAELDNSD